MKGGLKQFGQEDAYQRIVRSSRSSLSNSIRRFGMLRGTISLFKEKRNSIDHLDTVEKITIGFEKVGIRCVVGGSIGAIPYMPPRATSDIDMNLTLRSLSMPSNKQLNDAIKHIPDCILETPLNIGHVPSSTTRQRHIHGIGKMIMHGIPIDLFAHENNEISKRLFEKCFLSPEWRIFFPLGECVCFWKMMRSAEYYTEQVGDITPYQKHKYQQDILDIQSILIQDNQRRNDDPKHKFLIDREWVEQRLIEYESDRSHRSILWKKLVKEYSGQN